ncbi:hypothetical protein [Paenibacillus sp. MBLB4367]|uniref:hypothetical protein n=1 Tax=Paenibacillus sp. MBLB4367 TaxID=3384767 RepID=UPI0039082C1E
MKKKPFAYENDFIRFSDKVEKIIVYVVYALIAGVIVSQALLQHSAVREWVTQVDALEGVHYEGGSNR